MNVDDVWDIIEVHRLKSMVNDVWLDGEIIMITVKTPRTVEFLEQLFANSSIEVMVSL